MASNWQKNLAFITDVYEEVEVGLGKNARNVRFYAVSMESLFKLRTIARPMAQALFTLFGGDEKDVGSAVKTIESAEGTSTHTEVAAILPELARYRTEARQLAIAALTDTTLQATNASVFGELFRDSMREEFQDASPSADELGKWVRSLEIEVFAQMVMGLVHANSKVFADPIKAALKKMTEKALSAAKAKLNGSGERATQSHIEPAPVEAPAA